MSILINSIHEPPIMWNLGKVKLGNLISASEEVVSTLNN